MSKTGPSTALAEQRDAAIEAAGGNVGLLDRVAAGLSFREVCEEIGIEGSSVNQSALRRRLARQCPEEYEQAKKDSADALAEKALEQYGDKAPVTSADRAWRADKAGWYRWMSEVRSGRDQKGIQINIGQLHLDALRAAGKRPDRTDSRDLMGRPAARILEAEVIEDE
jgi:hypothetical protein